MSLRDYFSNNKIFTGTEKPTQGKFGVGDIIVNIGPNSAEEPMWICVEAGTPGVWELCSGVNEEEIGNMNELQTTNKSSIVGAINELFQSANNGKELIANAIGEPLDASDTFSAMSGDINGLLAKFKTNMMNNGITVNSSDKFKSLIDKIATMAEEGSGKGIQYASGNGVISYRNLRDVGFPVNIDFVPTLLFVDFDGVYNNNTCCNVMTGDCIAHIGGCGSNTRINFILKYENGYVKTVSVEVNTTYNNIDNTTNFTWYAIGVGEEDTTLRDSLASILGDKGVEVNPEDDMASLISKVDNISGGLDIISATELPATGKENQICVITENPVDKFIITPNVDYTSNVGNEIVVYTGTPYTSGLQSGYFLTSGLNNITEYYFDKIIQNSERKNSYIYINSTWEQMTKAYISWLENGIFMNSELFGGHTNNSWFTINSEGVTFKPSTSFNTNVGIATKNRIDFNIYNKVSLKIKTVNPTGWLYLMAIDSTTRLNENGSETSLSNLNSYAGTKYQWSINLSANDILYYDIDISSWSGNYYLAIVYSSSSVSSASTNNNITIIDALIY